MNVIDNAPELRQNNHILDANIELSIAIDMAVVTPSPPVSAAVMPATATDIELPYQIQLMIL